MIFTFSGHLANPNLRRIELSHNFLPNNKARLVWRPHLFKQGLIQD